MDYSGFAHIHMFLYPSLIHEFYVNLYVDEINEQFDGIEIYVNEKLLNILFELSGEGNKYTGVEFARDEQGEIVQIHHDFILCKLIEKCKAQLNLEMVTKVLDLNDLGLVRCMFHWALTKSIKPKGHSQSTLT